MSGGTQSGYGSVSAAGNATHAVLWHGTAVSLVDLNPTGFDQSHVFGAEGNSQVGDASTAAQLFVPHAMLWLSTAASAVDLTPPGYDRATAIGVSGNLQVGYGHDPTLSLTDHALVWSGTPGSVVDLHQFLTSNFSTSAALGVDSSGNIVGYGFDPDTNTSSAILWTPLANVPEAGACILLGMRACSPALVPFYRRCRRRARRTPNAHASAVLLPASRGRPDPGAIRRSLSRIAMPSPAHSLHRLASHESRCSSQSPGRRRRLRV